MEKYSEYKDQVFNLDNGNESVVKFRSSEDINNDQIWSILDTQYEVQIPVATNQVLGGVKVGSGLSIDGNGVLSSTGGGGGAMTNVKPIQRRFLICTEGQWDDGGGNIYDAPFVCDSNGFMFDYDNTATELYLYDTTTYNAPTELITLISVYDDGESEVTAATITISGTPNGYALYCENNDSGDIDTINANNLNEVVGFNINEECAGDVQDCCDLYAVKINNGLVIHFNSWGINQSELPKIDMGGGMYEDIPIELGSYLDTVLVGGAIYRCDSQFENVGYWTLAYDFGDGQQNSGGGGIGNGGEE